MWHNGYCTCLPSKHLRVRIASSVLFQKGFYYVSLKNVIKCACFGRMSTKNKFGEWVAIILYVVCSSATLIVHKTRWIYLMMSWVNTTAKVFMVHTLGFSQRIQGVLGSSPNGSSSCKLLLFSKEASHLRL